MNETKKKNVPPVVPFSELMPRAEELEEAVLGAILAEAEAAAKFIPQLHPDCFYSAPNQLVFEACRNLSRDGLPVDILTVTERMRADDTLEAAGGPFYIARMSGQVASSAHTEYHVAVLNEYRLRRNLRMLCMKTDREAADMTSDPDDVLAALTKGLADLGQGLSVMNELTPIAATVDEVLARLDERIAGGDTGLTGTDTGIAPLNEMFMGWQPGTLNIIAGCTGEGKTAVLMYTLLRAAEEGRKVCLVSLESNADKLTERLMLIKTGIDPARWRRGSITPEEREEIGRAAEVVSRFSFCYYDRSDISMDHTCMMVKGLYAQGRCDLMGLDYLQLMREPRRGSSTRAEEVAGYSRALKKLALQLDIPVIALCQFNRDVAQNTGRVPQMENIRESGAIEQDADTVTMIYHPHKAHLKVEPESGYPVTEDMMVLIVGKNRNGATGQGYMSHNRAFTQFAEYEPSAEHLLQLAGKDAAPRKEKGWRENDPRYQEFAKRTSSLL